MRGNGARRPSSVVRVHERSVGFRIILFLTTGAISFPSAGDFSISPPLPLLPCDRRPRRHTVSLRRRGLFFSFFIICFLFGATPKGPPESRRRSRCASRDRLIDAGPSVSRLSRPNPPRRPADDRRRRRPKTTTPYSAHVVRSGGLLLLLFYRPSRPK